MPLSLNRRAFLKTALSGAAQLLFGRYDAIVKVLSPDGASALVAAATSRLDPIHLVDYYNLFEHARWVSTDKLTGAYTFNASCFLPDDEKHTLADLPSFSQKTLREIYSGALNSFEEEIQRLSLVLRYKDDIDPIAELMQAHADKISALTDTSAEWILADLRAIANGFGTHEKLRDILERTLADYSGLLDEIRHHLSPQSLNILRRTPFISLPEAGFDIPYLFDPDHIRGVAESIAFKDHGHFLDIMDAAPEWGRFLTALGETDSARNKLAHRCLKWEPSYFNRDLMQKAGITEDHLNEGLRMALQEELERKGSALEISDHAYREMLHQAGVEKSRMEDAFLRIEDMIDNGELEVRHLTPSDDASEPQRFEVTITTTAATKADPHLGADMDDVTDTIATAIDGFTHCLERTGPYRAEITVDDFWPTDFLKSLTNRTKYASQHGGFSAQLRRIRQKGGDFTSLIEMAKKLRPTLGL